MKPEDQLQLTEQVYKYMCCYNDMNSSGNIGKSAIALYVYMMSKGECVTV